jgi:hypothetical protein
MAWKNPGVVRHKPLFEVRHSACLPIISNQKSKAVSVYGFSPDVATLNTKVIKSAINPEEFGVHKF